MFAAKRSGAVGTLGAATRRRPRTYPRKPQVEVAVNICERSDFLSIKALPVPDLFVVGRSGQNIYRAELRGLLAIARPSPTAGG